jgi:hypothetical protein
MRDEGKTAAARLTPDSLRLTFLHGLPVLPVILPLVSWRLGALVVNLPALECGFGVSVCQGIGVSGTILLLRHPLTP